MKAKKPATKRTHRDETKKGPAAEEPARREERKPAKPTLSEGTVDEEVEESFPASDPPSWTPTRAG